MTTTMQTKPAAMKRLPMTSLRKTSLTAGVLYLITFVSIPTIGLYKSVRGENFLTGAEPDTPVLVGGLLEIIVALAGIGTALVLYPVVKRQNHSAALGFVAIRTLEAATIFAGVVSLLSIVALRDAGAGASGLIVGQSLATQYQWTFLLGQSLLPGMNALLLGTVLYKSGLVPKVLPLIGLIGAPLIFASVIAKYFGVYDELSVWSLVGALPIAVWEFSLGVYLTVKGFRTCRITTDMTTPDPTSSSVRTA